MFVLSFVTLFAPLLAPRASGQVPPERALATFTVHDPELELSLWASEPLFVNPTCIDIDHKGRVWVCESVNYRYKLHPRPVNRPEGDRIVILEDTKGTGKADKATTFYQAPDFLAPLGIAVAKDPVGPGYKVYVCHSPDILLFEDKDGDGKADGPPKKLLTGFNGIDHDHGVHGILIGPDGKLYFSVGDQGVHNLQSSDGKGRKWTTNHTDCQGGTIWRCDLDGKNLELIAHNFRNEYEPCVDSFGNIFVSDNDDDGSQQTRICYVMPGGNYGYWPRGPGQTHWHEEQPGVVPKILRTGFGSPTGMCVYEGTLLPKKYWGQLLHTDAGPRQVRCYHLKPQGAGYEVERQDIVTSTDTWFRPSDICVAPDGSVFIADWYDPGVGGHGMGDTTRGRIYRLAPKGNKPSVPKINLDSIEGQLAALGSPALSVRYMAIEKLKREWTEKIALFLLWMADDLRVQDEKGQPIQIKKVDPWLRARILYLWPQNETLVGWSDAIKDPDARFRALPPRKLDGNGTDYDFFMFHLRKDKEMKALFSDGSAAVRRELLLLLAKDDSAKRVKPMIYKLAKQYDGKDRFYLEAIGIAVGHHDQKRREIILADFEKEFPEWNDKVADLVWELGPPRVMARLSKLLMDSKISSEQRARIVDILAASDDKDAGKVLLKLLQTDPPKEVGDRAIDYLKQFLPGRWRELRQSTDLAETIEELNNRSWLRGYALALIVAAEKADAADDVARIAYNPWNGEPVVKEAVLALGFLPSAKAVEILQGSLLENYSSEAIQALGCQARQKPDWPGTAAAAQALQGLVLELKGIKGRRSQKRELELRLAAAAALAESRQGTVWLLDVQANKQLPQVLSPDVARLLRNSPYPDLRQKARAVWPPPAKLDPKKLPSLASLALRKGDPARGKLVIASSFKTDLQCLKCHIIRSIGGSIGPDLTVIGKKASRENLFESILFPSRAIADQYINWVIETKDGLSRSGLIVEETADHLTLRDANGKDTKIANKDIESRSKSPNSIMPSDLVAYLTEDDLVDVVEYLFTLRTPSLVMDAWHIADGFDNGAGDAGLDRAFPPERKIELRADYAGKFGPVSWRWVSRNEKGYVDLQAFLAGISTNVVAYLYREVESPADQEALVLLGTTGCAKLWVNGQLVYTNRRNREAIPEDDSVKIQLKKGRNPLLIKITNGDGPYGFYLTLLAEQELKVGN
jgi:putative membrane-bound dehydrogenase-like protein